ncbi:MAG TPA: hypothetical protein VHP63_03635 [candidate division Zixibacteria bacterium]|nr:hypothetical protein [candidate division Zixibacteria bacterium]
MKGKYLALAAILGGLTFFVWGFLWHAALPVYESVMFEFSDSRLVNTVIQQNASHGNGVYYTMEGAFVAVNFAPDMHNKEADMGSMIPIEFILNVLTALFLAIAIGKVNGCGSVMKGALFLGMLGLTAEIAIEGSYWNWYGFSTGFSLVNFVGEILAWFLAGLVITFLHFKMNK